jgi:hypothetical protein
VGVLASAATVADAALADKYTAAWSIDPTCGQVGVAPHNLSVDLAGLTTYDFSCYSSGPYVKRWSSKDGLEPADFFGEDADLVGSAIDYLMGILGFIVPILAFGILSVSCCAFWSCGMLRCCAGANGKKRCCCGICCANPPKFTEGSCEWFLMLFTIFLGVVVAGLSFKGLGINSVQNDAVENMGGSIDLMNTWMVSASRKMDNTIDSFGNVESEIGVLQTVFAGMKTTEIKSQASTVATELDSAMSGAKDAISTVNDTIASLSDAISGIEGMSDQIGDINGYRNTGMLVVWAVLATLMFWEILTALLRQWKPECTQKVSCIFGFVTFLYLLIMLLLFIVLTVFALITVLLGDVCTTPDASITSIIGGVDLGGGSNDDAAAVTTTAAGGIAMPAIGVELMTYFIDCDTNDAAGYTNSFNPTAVSVFTTMKDGLSQVGTMFDLFNDKEPEMETAFNEATAQHDAGTMSDSDYAAAEKKWNDFQADKTAAFNQLNKVLDEVSTLTESIEGTNSSSGGAIPVPEAQGMTSGLFSVVQCYQVNSRYQAVVNMLCSQFFDTLAMTVEYLLVAGVLMVVVEFCKRWMRPYNQEYEKGNAVTPVGEDRWDVAKGRSSNKINRANGSIRPSSEYP